MSDDIEIALAGVTVSHRLPGPFSIEIFSSGLACVLNAHGINWLHAEELKGQTLLHPVDAIIAATLLNREGGYIEQPKITAPEDMAILAARKES